MINLTIRPYISLAMLLATLCLFYFFFMIAQGYEGCDWRANVFSTLFVAPFFIGVFAQISALVHIKRHGEIKTWHKSLIFMCGLPFVILSIYGIMTDMGDMPIYATLLVFGALIIQPAFSSKEPV